MELPSVLVRLSEFAVIVLSPLLRAEIPPERVLWDAEAPTEMAPEAPLPVPWAMAISTPPVTARICSSLEASMVSWGPLPLLGALMVLPEILAVIGLEYLFSAPAPAPDTA